MGLGSTQHCVLRAQFLLQVGHGGGESSRERLDSFVTNYLRLIFVTLHFLIFYVSPVTCVRITVESQRSTWRDT